MRRVLAENLQFRRLWAGQAISQLGDQVTFVALPLVAVLVLDASPGEMGVLTAAVWLPNLLLSLALAVWADRGHGLRRMLVVADAGRAVVLLTVPVAYWLDVLTLAQLIGVALGLGAFQVLFSVGNSVYFLRVVGRDDLVEAQAAMSASRSAAFMGGPPLAGVLVQLAGAPVALVLDALSFVASAFFVRRIDVEDRLEVEHGESVRTRLAEGVRFLFGHAVLRAFLGCVTTINFFNFAFAALVVLFMARDLGLSPTEIGVVLGAGAVGGLVGAALGPRIGRRIGMGPAVVVGSVLFPAPLLLFPLAGGPKWLVLAMLFVGEFLAGLGVMIFDIHGNSLSLLLTPERLRTRQYAVFNTVNYGSRPIGALVGGALGATIGVREALFVAAAGALGGVLWLLASPARSLREVPVEAV
jgi:MFS family permease